MKAFVLEDFDSEPRLLDNLPEPEPGNGELLVQVRDSSVNPVDNAIAGGALRGRAEYRFPVIIGRDYAGVVERLGPGVGSFAVGDEVFGFLLHADPDVNNGSWAEKAVVPAKGGIAHKPESTDFATAGAAPLAALTAIAAVDALELGEGELVLIVGAAGGVGSFAVQLARRAGARIIAPGLPEDESYLSDLGVDRVVPRDGDVPAEVRKVQSDGAAALIDTVHYSTEEVEAYASGLGDGPRIASSVGAAGEGPGRHNVMGLGDPDAVETLARLLEEGALRVPIQRTYGLDEAAAALADLPAKHTQGKLAIRIAS
jgi:NADPH:quinone reductase